MKSLPACLIFRLSPALKVTVSPVLTSAFDLACPAASAPEPSLSDVATQPRLLSALARLPALTSLFALSASTVATFPASALSA